MMELNVWITWLAKNWGWLLTGIVLAGYFAFYVLAMREHVDEQRAGRPQPRRDPAQQQLVVAHVLEHLDGHHAIEARGR